MTFLDRTRPLATWFSSPLIAGHQGPPALSGVFSRGPADDSQPDGGNPWRQATGINSVGGDLPRSLLDRYLDFHSPDWAERHRVTFDQPPAPTVTVFGVDLELCGEIRRDSLILSLGLLETRGSIRLVGASFNWSLTPYGNTLIPTIGALFPTPEAARIRTQLLESDAAIGVPKAGYELVARALPELSHRIVPIRGGLELFLRIEPELHTATVTGRARLTERKRARASYRVNPIRFFTYRVISSLIHTRLGSSVGKNRLVGRLVFLLLEQSGMDWRQIWADIKAGRISRRANRGQFSPREIEIIRALLAAVNS